MEDHQIEEMRTNAFDSNTGELGVDYEFVNKDGTNMDGTT